MANAFRTIGNGISFRPNTRNDPEARIVGSIEEIVEEPKELPRKDGNPEE